MCGHKNDAVNPKVNGPYGNDCGHDVAAGRYTRRGDSDSGMARHCWPWECTGIRTWERRRVLCHGYIESTSVSAAGDADIK